MNTFFFKKVPQKHQQDFIGYYTHQNLDAMRNTSLIFFVLNLSFRIYYCIFPYSLNQSPHITEYNISNWVYLCVTPFFFFASRHYLHLLKKRKKKVTPGMLYISIAFALYLIFSGMTGSFIAMHNLRNTMTLYLIGLLTVSIICVFEYIHALTIVAITGVVFSIALFYITPRPFERVANELVSIVLLTGYYLITRYIYAYKASHYEQLTEIKQKNLEIERASLFKNEVLGMVAHDLRNPIAAIESLTMIMELENLDDDMQDNVNMIKASCIKARLIIEDLLEVAKQDNDNKDLLDAEVLDMNQLLQSYVDEWNKQQATQHNPIILIAPNYPLYARINVQKFHRVIDNLISNALKFSKENCNVEVHLRHKSNKVFIEVKDHGVGIPKDMLPYVFERFTKAGRPGLHGEQSTGLGLSIARQIIENHMGQIDVDSVENEGSTFRIQLPQILEPFN